MISSARICAIALLAALGACSVSHAQTAAARKTVLVTSIVEHPALDAVKDGLKEELLARGFEDGKNLRFEFQTAQGNPAVAAQIARQYVGAAPNVIVAISTASAQAVVSATRTVPVVFSAITDPVSAKLVPGPGASKTNVTGISDMAPVADHLALIREMLPRSKNLGVVYSPGEANSIASLNLLKEQARLQGFNVIESPAQRSADVPAATRALVGKVDLVYVPQDNAVASALDAVIDVATRSKIPVFAADEPSVVKGALATIGFDYFQLGRQTAVLVAQILGGQDAGTVPWKVGSGTDLIVNTAAAKRLGITLPESVLKRAKRVVEN